MREFNKLLIIYNPNAMQGKIESVLPYIKGRLSLRYSVVDSAFTLPNNSAEDIAIKNASRYDIIVSCGGDGTLNQVVNGVKKSGYDPVVAILPFGLSNDVAKTLKIPTKLDKAIDTILRLNTINYDLMFDGSNYITSTLAAGYLADTAYATSNSSKKKFGRLAYIAHAFKRAFKLKEFPMTFTCDKERTHDKFIFLMLLNDNYVGGIKVNHSNLSDNKTYLVAIKKTNKFHEYFSFVRLFLFGLNAVKKSKNVIIRECTNIEIENHSNTPFSIDGEKTKFLKKTISVKNNIKLVTR